MPRERLARGDRLRAEKFGRETERRAQLRDGVAFALKKGDTLTCDKKYLVKDLRVVIAV